MERKLRKKLPGGRFENVPAVRSRIMSAIRGKHTKSTERALRMILIRAGLKGWKLHPPGLAGNPDLYFPRNKVVIFADGCFWHGCRKCGHIPKTRTSFWRAKIIRNRVRDRSNTHKLQQLGYRVFRVWEHSLCNRRYVMRLLTKIKLLLAAELPE
jgi:DNA mismatch endonuclease Vsr